MTQQIINLGLIPNDGSGDALRVGAQKINENFTELYDRGIPEQAGNNGKVLTTSGTVLRWDRVTDITGNAGTVTNGVYTTGLYDNPSWITGLAPSKVLPNQSGNNGKYLTTDGNSLAWANLETVSVFDYNNLINKPVFPDNTSDLVNDSGFITSSALVGYATETYVNSRGFITSNGLPSQSGNSGKYLTTNGSTLSWATVTQGGSSDRLVNGSYSVLLASDGSLELGGGFVANRSTAAGVQCEVSTDTVIYTAVSGGTKTIKLLVQFEGIEDSGDENYHTHSCDMIVVKRNSPEGVVTVDATIYGIIYTSTAPLVTFDAQWNSTSSKIEVTARPVSSSNNGWVKVFATEITLAD